MAPGKSGAAAFSLGGVFWLTGWLFTIGYVGLEWWQIILGLFIWPYYLGAAL